MCSARIPETLVQLAVELSNAIIEKNGSIQMRAEVWSRPQFEQILRHVI